MLAHRMLVNSEACAFGSWTRSSPTGPSAVGQHRLPALILLDDAQVLTPEPAAQAGRSTTLVALTDAATRRAG